MYGVSDDYRTAMKAPVQQFDIKGTIGTIEFDTNNILEGSLSITNQCSDDTEIAIGQVYIGEMNVTMTNISINRYSWRGLQIVIRQGLLLQSGEMEYVQLGVFNVEEANSGMSGVEVVAYDNMSLFNKLMNADTTSGQPYDLLMMACNACGVELGMTRAEVEALPNGTMELGLYSENEIETWQDYIAWLSQALGGFATMDRQGRLVIRTYNQDVVDTIDDMHRFNNATFSNFETRYTGLSVVNIEEQTTQYYKIDPDDGLTMNLGSNPFLQYGTAAEKDIIRKNILNAIAKIQYVPFSVSMLGSPAYDLGDVLCFSEGIADGDKLYCITKYTNTYKTYELQGVGSNPALASGKSKTDKDISGLMSQMTENENVFVTFENAEEIEIGDQEKKKIINIHIVARKDTKVEFQAEILCTAHPNEGNMSMVAAVTYEQDHSELLYHPEETWIDGKHILSLYYVVEMKANTYMDWGVYLTASGGSVVIAASEARATIKGQGLVAGGAEWDGTITIEEEIPLIPIKPVNDIKVRQMTDEANAAVQKPVGGSFSEIFTKIPINYSPNIRIRTFDDNFVIQPVMVTKTFSLSDMEPNEYISDDLKVKTEYQAAGEPAEIDTGYRKDIQINKEMFEEINGIEVVVNEISPEG